MDEYPPSNERRISGGISSLFHLFKASVAARSGILIRNLLIVLFLTILVLVVVAGIIFWIARKGSPEVTVPRVTDKELIDGLLILQKKRLNILVDPRYFSDYPKNVIVEQDPGPGSVVREGKDVKLIVSKGPIISIVEDYSGKTLAFVKNRLQEIFSFQGKSIRLGNVSYVISDLPRGTIIGQFPPPNTPITNVESVDLIISKGKEIQAFRLDDYTGQNINEAMQILALRGVLVQVITEEVIDPTRNGLIISQDPMPGTLVNRNDAVTFNVGYLPSEREKDKLYARVLNFDVPSDLQDIQLRIVVRDRIGEREIYNDRNTGGDSISIPFKSYSNTTVYIYVNDGVYEVRKME
jgi:beta-lactam-binding protein with PASTA domain